MIITTVSSLNYLSRAEILAKSIKEFHPEAKIILCLVERTKHPDIYTVPFFDKVILAKDLGIPNFDNFIFKYTVSQASWALKSEILKYLLQTEQEHDQLIYLDSDIRLYSPLKELNSNLQNNAIVLTPHVLNSDPSPLYLWHGIFNAGLIGINNTKEAYQFIQWWSAKVNRHCYRDRSLLLYDDQGWIKLAPTLFRTFILKHPGYNVSFWNFTERKIGKRNQQHYTVNDEHPLRLFHFSSLDTYLKNKIIISNNTTLQTLYRDYKEELEQSTLSHLANETWSYSNFNNGKPIKDSFRSFFRNHSKLNMKDPNPFNLTPKFFRENMK